MHRPVFHHRKLLPLTTGIVWAITLLALLIYWLADGRPRYPGQASPYVAFVSDIGAFRLQPLFITGGGQSLASPLPGTLVSVQRARRERILASRKESGRRTSRAVRGGFPSWRVRSMRLPALAGSALRFFWTIMAIRVRIVRFCSWALPGRH